MIKISIRIPRLLSKQNPDTKTPQHTKSGYQNSLAYKIRIPKLLSKQNPGLSAMRVFFALRFRERKKLGFSVFLMKRIPFFCFRFFENLLDIKNTNTKDFRQSRPLSFLSIRTRALANLVEGRNHQMIAAFKGRYSNNFFASPFKKNAPRLSAS